MNDDGKNEEMNDFMRGILEEFSSRKEEDVITKLAGFLFNYYNAFQAVGFSEERAFAMVGLILTSIIRKA